MYLLSMTLFFLYSDFEPDLLGVTLVFSPTCHSLL